MTEIEQQAKEILDQFYEVLSKKIKDKELPQERIIINNKELRKAKPSCDPELKELFLNLAPKKNEDFVIANKAKWI